MQPTSQAPIASAVRHPLAPLTEQEAAAACRAALASGAVHPGARISYCALAEPTKQAVLSWDGTSLPREITVVTYEPKLGRTSTLTIALPEGTLVSCMRAPAGQAPIMLEEWLANAEAVRQNPRFKDVCARRGVTDMSTIKIDPWPAGNLGLPVDAEGRAASRTSRMGPATTPTPIPSKISSCCSTATPARSSSSTTAR